jgi:GH15 family glucan-1,4-alpha-glucosidase
MSKLIEDYGLIGNMISAALVARDGSIDWLCLPRFDSPACFAALLGNEDHGRWKICASGTDVRITRRYLPDTAVLETRFETPQGAATLTDFMPFTEDEEMVDVVRLVRGERGEVVLDMELVLRFHYGQAVPWVKRRDYGLSAIAGADAVELHTTVPLGGQDMKTVSRFTVRAGQSVPFTLSYHRSYKSPHFIYDRTESLDRTVSRWREWARHCHFQCDNPGWREAVVRSLITLKLLIYQPTGGIIAAPTTSLPESLGGPRNWDYRYCWLRDSAITLYALLNAGYRDEAVAWRQWLVRATTGLPDQMHIMYGVAGERWLPEIEIPWLPGYAGSKPVRVGNAAIEQTQLDVYGEVMDTLHAARAADLSPMADAWKLQRVMLDHLEKIWDEPDFGIWEVRGDKRHFTHSKLMCWVAFDRAIKSCEQFDLEGPVERWRGIREAIFREICTRGFNTGIDAFVQSYDTDVLDAALLVMPQVGFLPADDPRVVGTVAAIERTLVRDGLVLRYDPAVSSDGVDGREGTFLACSFWLADAYVMMGRLDDASALFDRLLGLRNDLGLMAEQYDTEAGRQVGNFPQAFSHLGLVNTVYNLIDAHGPASQRAGLEKPRTQP